jgi:hypothetical protein
MDEKERDGGEKPVVEKITEELETESDDAVCLYQGEASPGTNDFTFVPGGLE